MQDGTYLSCFTLWKGKGRKWHIYHSNPSLPFQIFKWRESHHRPLRWFNRNLLKVEEQFLSHVFCSLLEQTSQAWWVHCFSVRSWQTCDAVDMFWKHNILLRVKCRKKKKRKRMTFHLDFILHLKSIYFFPFLTIGILHSCTWSHLLKYSVSVTFQSSWSLPSLGSEALDLRHKSRSGNFLIEQKPGYMKPYGKMYPPFLGLGGELWEQPADK